MKRYVIKRIKDGKYWMGYLTWVDDIKDATTFRTSDVKPRDRLEKGEIAVEVEIRDKSTTSKEE